MKDAAPSLAGLYQRKFLVVGEPLRTYSDTHDFPFLQIGHQAARDTRRSTTQARSRTSSSGRAIGGQSVRLHPPRPRQGEPAGAPRHPADLGRRALPELRPRSTRPTRAIRDRKVPADGQKIAFAAAQKGGDTVLATASISLRGKASLGDSRPLHDARQGRAPRRAAAVGDRAAARSSTTTSTSRTASAAPRTRARCGPRCSSTRSSSSWRPTRSSHCPSSSSAAAAAGATRPAASSSPTSDRGLSRLTGTVGDVAGMAKQQFKPEDVPQGALPKLFGLVAWSISSRPSRATRRRRPTVVSEALDRDRRAPRRPRAGQATAENAVAEANQLVARAASKAAALQNEAQAALADGPAVETKVTEAVDDFVALLGPCTTRTKAAVAGRARRPRSPPFATPSPSSSTSPRSCRR